MRQLWRWGLVLALWAGAFVGYQYWSGRNADRPRFRVAHVAYGDITATISATGTIEPEEVVDVGAQVAGMIKNLGQDPSQSDKTIDYGSAVEQETVLAQIDDSIYKAQVQQAAANLQRAEADLLQLRARLTQRERAWNRAQELRRRSSTAISDTEYELAEAEAESAKSALAVGEADVAQARSSLDQAQINLDYTTIRSPVKGVIIDRRVNVGQTVVASLNAPSLFLIATDIKRLQVWAAVNEADVGQIRPGQPVRFTVDAFPDQVFRGEVAQIRWNATMTQNVVTYTVVVSTDNSSGQLIPYLTANLQFEIDRRHDVLLLPNAAFRFQPPAELVQQPEARAGTSTNAPADEEASRADNSAAPQGANHGAIWVVDQGGLRPIEVEIGLSDGAYSEVSGPEVREGLEVVVGLAQPDDAVAETTNPFGPPQLRARRPSS